MGKKDGDETKLTKEEKAAKKAAKAAKRAAEEAGEAPPSKKVKSEGEDGKKEKLSKEEKAAKKAKKAAKEAAAAAGGSSTDEKAEKKKKKKDKDAGDDDEKAAKKAKKAEAAAAEAAPEDGAEVRVFIANLPFSMTDDWITEEFASAGAVKKVDWLNHSDTGRFKGSGFLTFSTKAEADKAVELNGKELEGRPMKVELATPRKAAPSGGAGGASDPGEPSNSIFCGNLAWSTTEEGLRSAFSECGTIERIKWVEKDGEWKGICFIDFDSIDSATKAVALSGTEVGGRAMRINFSKPRAPAADKPAWGAKPGRVERPYKPAGEKPEGCVELFCGNLSWTIDETKITEFFKQAGATVSGMRWLNDKESGEFKGIGFVSFNDTTDVDKAVTLGGEQCDGRPIRLDYAGQKKEKQGAWQGGW